MGPCLTKEMLFRMDPLLPLKHAANVHKLANYFSQEMLPMPLHGQIVAAKKYQPEGSTLLDYMGDYK